MPTSPLFPKPTFKIILLLSLLALLLVYLKFRQTPDTNPTTLDECISSPGSLTDPQTGTCISHSGQIFAPSPTPPPPTPIPDITFEIPSDWQSHQLPLISFALPADFSTTESTQSSSITYTATASESAVFIFTIQTSSSSGTFTDDVSRSLSSLPGDETDWDQSDITLDDTPALFLSHPNLGYRVFITHPDRKNFLVLNFNPAFSLDTYIGEAILESITFPTPTPLP